MRTNTWRTAGFVLTTGLFVLGTTAAANADKKPAEGLVRISDSASQSTITSAANSVAVVDNIAVVANPPTYGGGYLVHEGPGYVISGNRFVDSWKMQRMKYHAWKTRRRLKQGAKPSCGTGHCGRSDPNCCPSAYGYTKKLPGEIRLEKLFCRFGYFHPTGCCGHGCPPMDTYHLLYAANPRYFDQRDSRVYAAQGYGVPMGVPLAANVRHTYNYGWGIPASRLTPVSRILP